jgi:hypothetical protein
MMITVHFYDPSGARIVRTHAYQSLRLARAALARAAKRHQIAGFAVTRTAADPPTCHH